VVRGILRSSILRRTGRARGASPEASQIEIVGPVDANLLIGEEADGGGDDLEAGWWWSFCLG
jgi:hypothetical protein